MNDEDCSRGRPTCAGVDLPRATDVLLTGRNTIKRRAAGPGHGPGLVSKGSPIHSNRIGELLLLGDPELRRTPNRL
jgi:hypothetical protein